MCYSGQQNGKQKNQGLITKIKLFWTLRPKMTHTVPWKNTIKTKVHYIDDILCHFGIEAIKTTFRIGHLPMKNHIAAEKMMLLPKNKVHR